LVVLDLLVFFAIYRPLGNKVAMAERRHAELRQTIRDQQFRVEVLKKFQEALPQTGKGLEDFMTNRIPPRREAYSITDHLIHEGADAAKVKVMGMSFRLDPEHNGPLQRLGFEINVQGAYSGVLKFAHALETAKDVILVREFFITPGDNGILDLRLGADLYLTP
jgi:Tfp pilus assembly protein PilO